jgi:hypothetical protein
MAPEILTFRDWLINVRELAPRTAHVYAGMVGFGLRRGDPLFAVKHARTRGSLDVAVASLHAWGDYREDKGIGDRADRIARGRKVGSGIVQHATEEERKVLHDRLDCLEEPYRSALLVVTESGLRFGMVLSMGRMQVEVAAEGQRVPLISGDEVVDMWLSPEPLIASFHNLLAFGGWEKLQDLLGRDYAHAYRQVRIILRHECRVGKIRNIRPGELLPAKASSTCAAWNGGRTDGKSS